MFIEPMFSGRFCYIREAGWHGRLLMSSRVGVMALTLTLIRLSAISQRVGDAMSVACDVCRGVNKEVSSFSGPPAPLLAAAGRRDQGADLAGVETVIAPYPAIFDVEAGFWLPEGTDPGGLATGFGPLWTSLDTPGWAGGRLSQYISITELRLPLKGTLG